LVDSEFIREQYAVRKFFLCLDIANIIDELQIFIIVLQFLTARYKKKLKSYSDYFW